MMSAKAEPKSKLVQDFRLHEKDTGSADVQIAVAQRACVLGLADHRVVVAESRDAPEVRPARVEDEALRVGDAGVRRSRD